MGPTSDWSLTIGLDKFGLDHGSGVALAADGSLYIMTGVTISEAIAHFKVDYTTQPPTVQLLSVRPIASPDLEDIEIVPKP